jgi:glyoxylase-like metal-dependent hydrolase (beta-lactamase superfamily II)
MPHYYEIDFRQVHASKSGDAVAIRDQIGTQWSVHLVDGGYSASAPEVAKFIRDTHGTDLVNHVVVTHPDRDHAEGLAPILEQFRVGALWMLRPWKYAAQLYPYFPAGSTGRCNTGVKSLCWGFECQGLPWPFV